MPDDTRKHRDFVREPIEDKPVTALPGIGEVLGEKLVKKGFTKASALLGHFVQMGRDPEKFKAWLKETSGANDYQADLCTRALVEWCETFL
ncbi:barrier-to-autointegration factor-like protein [Cololabis saira]|uniref:barrier-to-autointegration factor-like protein n=1 Tax=Cololabis saira TaxID=129043 RepID=UPI002AD4B361|nr:barrier-to-autointegration factor-like protein [Cololabis saira]XP_061601341.1 barrier-to-autointegration factor-like protein [Cololabis saira]